MKYDLHSHSTASDGILSPTGLVQRALEQGVDMLALTDHDTVTGVEEARTYAATQPITLIAGVEISVVWQDKPIHLAALNIDEKNESLVGLLANQAALRAQRAVEIGEKLAKLGIPGAYEGAKKLAGGEVTRAHYGRFLVENHYVRDTNQAFKKYLSGGKPAYVKASWCSIEDAIEAVHRAGGVICVAHPLRYKMTGRWLRRLIADFKAMGGDGIEVAGCGQTSEQRNMLADWANEFGLYASAGSDFHYPTGWIELGQGLELPSNSNPIWELF